MKNIITFLFCTACLSSAFAQYDNRNWKGRDDNTVVYNDQANRHYDNNRSYQDARFIQYQKQQQLQKIDAQFNYQVQHVMNDWLLNRRAKRHALADLQARRTEQINNINCQYANNTYNNSRDDNGHAYGRRDDDRYGR